MITDISSRTVAAFLAVCTLLSFSFTANAKEKTQPATLTKPIAAEVISKIALVPDGKGVSHDRLDGGNIIRTVVDWEGVHYTIDIQMEELSGKPVRWLSISYYPTSGKAKHDLRVINDANMSGTVQNAFHVMPGGTTDPAPITMEAWQNRYDQILYRFAEFLDHRGSYTAKK